LNPGDRRRTIELSGGSDTAMQVTRIEYPLNGEWRLVLDPEDVGVENRWFAGKTLPESLPIQVPGAWDARVADYLGTGWYFREFEVGPEWAGRHATLDFEGASHYAEVWLNGRRLGEHDGAFTPFSLDAIPALSIGANLAAIRVVGRPDRLSFSEQEADASFAGLWGGVNLVGKPHAHIADVFIQPDLRHKRIVVLVAVSTPGRVRLRIEGTPHECDGPPGRLALPFPEFESWSPDRPTLYRLACELIEGGQVTDHASAGFGMREFALKGNRFCLNHQPTTVTGAFHWPEYPRSLAPPDIEALARRELELAKEAGFNLLCIRGRSAPQLTVRLADELGLMLYEEVAPTSTPDPSSREGQYTRQVQEMVLRDRNHPSVVAWGIAMPDCGAPGPPLEELCRVARTLDPTRVILSGWGADRRGKCAQLMRPYDDRLEACDTIYISQAGTADSGISQPLRGLGDADTVTLVGGLGSGGMEDLPEVLELYGADRDRLSDAQHLSKALEAAQRAFTDCGLDGIFGDFSRFLAATRDIQRHSAKYLIEAVRSNPNVAGYCCSRLCDGTSEFWGGVLDGWRRAKPVFETLKQVQKPLTVIVQIAQDKLVQRGETRIRAILVNDLGFQGRAEATFQAVGPTEQVLWTKKRNIAIGRSIQELWSGVISASTLPGTHRFVVRLTQDNRALAEGVSEFEVFEPTRRCNVEIHIVDPRGKWSAPCLALAREGTPEAPVHILPPLANTIRAYPDRWLGHIVAEVRDGATALVFEPPDDWNDFAEHIDPGLCATPRKGSTGHRGTYHVARLHPVFEGLPARDLMRRAYSNIVPFKTFAEAGDEDICGTFDVPPSVRPGDSPSAEGPAWGTHILVRRYGSGWIAFTHLRILDNLGSDPVADRLFVNLLKHFAQRAIPSGGPLPLPQRAMEWQRKERSDEVRRWMVLGPFPNCGGKGHEQVYPPEEEVDLGASYTGPAQPLTWTIWYALAKADYAVDLEEAFSGYTGFLPGAGYMYAEFTCDRSREALLKLCVSHPAKVWLNGVLVHEANTHHPCDNPLCRLVPVTLRRGRNACLLKVSKSHGPAHFTLDFTTPAQEPLALQWWR
jgi:hypothetical protein